MDLPCFTVLLSQLLQSSSGKKQMESFLSHALATEHIFFLFMESHYIIFTAICVGKCICSVKDRFAKPVTVLED